MESSLMKRYFALFAALAASVVLGGCKHTPPAGVAAEVNGQPITYDKLEKTYRTQYPQVPENANADLVQSQKLELLGSLITNEIMLQRALRLGLQAVDADVDAELAKMKSPYTKEEFEKQLADRHMSLDDLKALAPSAVVVTCGAQGYNKLNLSGENAKGVYSAKDFVYNYNQLPPYASEDFSTGKRIAVVGMGNVAADIMRWLLQDSPTRRTEEVIVIARRGPYEAKFSKKELGHLEAHQDFAEFFLELERVRARCIACGQDVSVEKIAEATFPGLRKDNVIPTLPKLTFRFLSSPKEIIVGPDGRIRQLVVTENDLVLRTDGSTGAKATDETSVLDVDTLIFAIGDKHDPGLGLPMGPDGYATKPNVESNSIRSIRSSTSPWGAPTGSKATWTAAWAGSNDRRRSVRTMRRESTREHGPKPWRHEPRRPGCTSISPCA